MYVRKEEVKLTLLIDGMILYVKKNNNPADHTHTQTVQSNKLIQQSCGLQNQHKT